MTTYTKLRSGAWGVRGEGTAPASGARVTVTKKSGETKAETVERVVWSGQGKWIASVAPSSAPRASRGGYNSGFGEFCYHTCPVGGFRCSPENGPCHDCE